MYCETCLQDYKFDVIFVFYQTNREVLKPGGRLKGLDRGSGFIESCPGSLFHVLRQDSFNELHYSHSASHITDNEKHW